MQLNDGPLSLYDVLELTPDATPQEIRSAYLRLKSAYGKDSVAHYSVFSREETEALTQNIENAYIVLSNPEKRRSYDEAQGFRASTAENLSSSDLAGLTSMPMRQARMEEPVHAFSPAETLASDLDLVIRNEQNWSGPAIRRIREARRITLEELSDHTRISRTYLTALEEENYQKLPALVYVRGFLQQVGRRLRIPADLLSRQYLERMRASVPDKQ
jgi:curved DNA-binding protein CbpA